MQLDLIHESVDDALGSLVKALGGAKKVGAQMRPELPVEQAASWLRDRLNPTRPARLNPDQVVWLLREGRKAGVHCAMQYISAEAGYHAEPMEPEDERAALQRDYINAVKVLQQITQRMDRVESKGLRSVA